MQDLLFTIYDLRFQMRLRFLEVARKPVGKRGRYSLPSGRHRNPAGRFYGQPRRERAAFRDLTAELQPCWPALARRLVRRARRRQSPRSVPETKPNAVARPAGPTRALR